MDYSLPGSSVHGISQVRILEWVAISFFRESFRPRDRTGSLTLQADSPRVYVWKWKCLSCVWPFVTPWNGPWNSSGQNTRVGSLSLLQRIFPTQGSNPGFLHFRLILYQLNRQGSPRILEWVSYHFSSGSSRSRNQTGVSCIASWATYVWVVFCCSVAKLCAWVLCRLYVVHIIQIRP